MTMYFLSKGAHDTADKGRCAMEWVSYIAGEEHSAHPICVDPVLRDFAIRVNDAMPDDERQKLRPYLARMIGTADDGLSEWRMFKVADAACRVWAPMALEAAGYHEYAQKMRKLAPVVDQDSANAADAAYAVIHAVTYAPYVAAYAADAANAAKAATYAGNAAAYAADAAAANAAKAAAAANAAKAATYAGNAAAYAADAAAAAAHVAAHATDAANAAANVWPSVLTLLDELLLKEVIELSSEVSERAMEVCPAA